VGFASPNLICGCVLRDINADTDKSQRWFAGYAMALYLARADSITGKFL
jgi:hypothetical protein